MDIRISKSVLKGSIRAVTSKSDVHRALICAALLRETGAPPQEIYCNVISEDIAATVSVLRRLHAEIEYKDEYILVSPIDREGIKRDVPELCCMESGSTLRFMLPVKAALSGNAVFTGTGRLPERPVEELLKELMRHGIKADGLKLPFSVEGKLEAGEFRLRGDISSQFFTGLLLAFPVIGEDCKLIPEGRLESSKYVDMTIRTMKSFGVEVEKLKDGFSYKAADNYYRRPYGAYETEGDWSNSAFFIAADALLKYKNGYGDYIDISGLREDSIQGDRAILKITREAVDCAREESGYVMDASEVPDLVPIAAVFLALLKGRHIIKNASRLRLKESDRLSAITTVLRALGADIEEISDGLLINGRDSFYGGCELDSFGDHRIAMSLGIAGLFCTKPIIIRGAEAVNKSYPDFFEDYRRLGGIADVI